MKLSIRSIYVTIYLLLAAVMFVLIHFWGVHLVSNSLIAERKAALYEEASSLSKRYFFNVKSINQFDDQTESSLRERLSSLQTMSHARYFLVDSTGRISVESTDRNSLEGQNFNDLNPTFLDNDTYIGHLNSSYLPQESLSIIYPLSEDYDMNGYLVIMTPLKALRANARQLTKDYRICFVVFFLVLLFTLLGLYCLTVHPLRQLSLTIREYSRGHYSTKMKHLPLREYDSLTTAVHNLASSSKNAGDYQKDFVANVSHDFRSPLTNIRGYIGAILDGTIPPEIQEKYLKIVLRETDRLTKLTEQLLEMNRYENNGIILNYSTFDINEVIRNAASSFEKHCTEKKISIHLIFNTPSLYVDADRDKISQVIQNLIDNAVKFSSPDSSIEIQTTVQKDKIFVTVSDHGIGIPEESLPHIWDRFYKTDVSRGKDKTGSGLGLAITKEIIDAHREYIHATSILGSGTDFSFSLRHHSSGI